MELMSNVGMGDTDSFLVVIIYILIYIYISANFCSAVAFEMMREQISNPPNY